MPGGCRSSPKTIAGDTSVGHSLCHAQAMEALCGIPVDAGAKIIRTIGLELERIANHVGDLGALSGDVAFLPPANYCGRMRGDFLNMSLLDLRQPLRQGPGAARRRPVPHDDDNRRDLTARIANSNPRSSTPSTCSFPPPASARVLKAAGR
jgi:hypothetical protein